MLSLSSVTSELSETFDSFFEVQWSRVSSGFYGLLSRVTNPHIYFDNNEYKPFYLSTKYSDESPKYHMCSIEIVDDVTWNQLMSIQSLMEERMRVEGKSTKKQPFKGFLYTSGSGSKMMNIRVYRTVPMKNPSIRYVTDSGDEEVITIDEFEAFMKTHRVEARLTLQVDATWSFKNSSGMAVFSPILLLKQRVNEQEDHSENMQFLMQM